MVKICLCLLLAGIIVGSNAFSPDRNRQIPGYEYLGTLRRPTTIGSRVFEERNYYASTFSGPWNDARRDCSDTFENGGLVSIEDLDESNAINKWLSDRGSSGATYWTSGQYSPDNDEWIWAANGNTVGFTKWNKGQPGANLNEKYRIGLKHLNQFSAGWKAIEDTETFRFICEKPFNRPQLPTGL